MLVQGAEISISAVRVTIKNMLTHLRDKLKALELKTGTKDEKDIITLMKSLKDEVC